MSQSTLRWQWALVVIGALSFSLPTLLSFYPPMSDLALHEAVIALLTHLGEPDFAPSSLYRLNLGHPNQLFHLVSAGLATLTGTRTAVKIAVAATQLLLILGAARLAHRSGKSPLLGLLAAPMALGWFFYWGLITNMVGLALLFFAFPFLTSTARTVGTPALVGVFAWFLLLFLAHETSFAMAVAFFFLLSLAWARSLGHAVRGALPCIAAGLVAVAQLRYQTKFFAKNVVRVPADFPTLGHRASRLMDSLFGTHPVEVWILQGAFCAVLAALLVVPRLKKVPREVRRAVVTVGALVTVLLTVSYVATRAAEGPDERGLVRWVSLVGALLIATFALRSLHAVSALRDGLATAEGRDRLRAATVESPYLVFGCLLLIVFWLAPFNWNSATLLYERALAPAVLLLGIWLAPRGPLPRITRLTLCILPLVILATGLPQFVESSRLARDLQKVIEQVPRGQAIAMIQIAPGASRGRTFSPQTVSMRVLAERGGRAGLQLTDSPISVVTMVPELRWERVATRLWRNGADLRVPHDLRMFSSLLVHVNEPAAQVVVRMAVSPYATHVLTSGEWMLFRSPYPPRPVDEPELPPGTPRSERLPVLCQAIADRIVHDLQARSWDDREGPGDTPAGFVP